MLVEIERQPSVSAFGHDIDRAGHCKNVADEGRLGRDLDADHRRLFLFLCGALLMQLAFGIARAAHEFVDHFLRNTRHRAFPTVRQKIDIEPLSRDDRVDLHCSHQRNADCTAVRVSACGAYIFGSIDVELFNSDRHRFIEGDNYNCAGNARCRLDRFVEVKQQPQIAAANLRANAHLSLNGKAVIRPFQPAKIPVTTA